MTGAGPAVLALFALAGVVAGYGTRVLVGRLRRGAEIGAGWCEAALAGLWSVTGAGWVFGASPGRWVPALLGLGWLAVAAGAVDIRHRRLPDALTIPAIPAALLMLVPLGWSAVLRGVGGAALAAGVYGTVHAVSPHALGAGDVKLAGSLGAVLAAGSWTAVLLAAVLSAVITVVLAVSSAVVSRAVVHRRTGVPHGPSMLAAAWLVSTGLAAGAALGAGGGG